MTVALKLCIAISYVVVVSVCCLATNFVQMFLQDPYLHRPLPFLIGSEEFDRSDDVGIGQLEPG